MTRSEALVIVGASVAQCALLGALGWAIWEQLPQEQREPAVGVLQATGGLPVIAAVAILGLLGFVLHIVFAYFVEPLRSVTEAARLIAVSNPRHRLERAGGREVRDMIDSVNLLAERYQTLGEDVEARIREANALIEDEKNTLSALMSKLTQGVVVCNPEGRILLYNPRAQRLLAGPTRKSGAGDWIGLGRSIYGVIDESVVAHALGNVRHRLTCGDEAVLVPFVAARPGGQMLSAHLVPILDHDGGLRGYILTLDDVTRRFGEEHRRGELLQSLTQGQRSAIGGIRAAIETVLTYPEMDEAGRREFFEVIRDEAMKVSEHLDHIEEEYRRELRAQLPVGEVMGSDVLAAVQRTMMETRGIGLEVSAPVEPIWLKIDSFAIIECLNFLVDQLIEWCRAEHLALVLEARRSLASFELQWTGATVHMDALGRWGLRNVTTDPHGGTTTLFQAIEQYGGAIWTDPPHADSRPRLRVVLPVSDTGISPADQHADGNYGHDFDFHLFEHRDEERDVAGLPLGRLAITVLDTETTGLDVEAGDEIIAVGAVRIVNGRILRQESFDSFVRPQRPISAASRAIHGITNEMVRAEPPIDEVLPRLLRFVEDTVIVGHNVDFDMRFIAKAGAVAGQSLGNPVLDTLLLEFAINPNQEDKSLEAIARRLGIEVTGRHTALGDALTTAEIFLALIPLLEDRGIRTLGDARATCAASPYLRLTA